MIRSSANAAEAPQTGMVTVGSVGTTTAEIPRTIGEFQVSERSVGTTKYTHQTKDHVILVTHRKSGAHRRYRSFTVSLHKTDSDIKSLDSTTIDHGPYEENDLQTATELVIKEIKSLSKQIN